MAEPAHWTALTHQVQPSAVDACQRSDVSRFRSVSISLARTEVLIASTSQYVPNLEIQNDQYGIMNDVG